MLMPKGVMQMAFDLGQVTFLFKERNSLQMKLLDGSIPSTSMAEASAQSSKDPSGDYPPLPASVAVMTFQDYDGMLLVFPNLQPAMRCLEFHARMAVLNAENEGWVEEGKVDVGSYGSEREYEERLNLLLGKMCE